MWKYDSTNKSWYRRVTSGFLTLIFTIKEENSQFTFNFIGNQSSSIQYHCYTIEQAKETADQDIKRALRWA